MSFPRRLLSSMTCYQQKGAHNPRFLPGSLGAQNRPRTGIMAFTEEEGGVRKKWTAGDRARGGWEGLVFVSLQAQQRWALGAGLSAIREALVLCLGFRSFLDFRAWQPGDGR